MKRYLIAALLLVVPSGHADPLTAWLDRSYYTTERQASVLCDVPGTVTVKTAEGKVLALGVGRTFDIADLPTGSHELTLAAGDETVTLTLIKRPPQPGVEWKVDRLRNAILRDDKPFFPFGLIMGGVAAPRDEAAFAEVAGFGMNTVVRWYQLADPATASAYHDMAARHGLFVVEPVDRFAKVNLTSAKTKPDFDALVNENLERMAAAAANVRARPTLAAWYSFDEPLKNQMPAAEILYHKLQEVDGYHPTVLLYSSDIPRGEQFTRWCDVLATDPYWTPADGGPRGSVGFLARTVAETRRRADAAGKIAWIVPMAEYWSGVRKRPILPKEQFNQTYLAIIHGAKGLIYFRYPFVHQQAADTFAALGKQVPTLGQIALTPEIAQRVHYEPKGDDVEASLRRNPAGGFMLLAANTRTYPVDVTVRVAGLTGEVKRLFSAEHRTSSGGAFTDRLESLATRAYTFEITAPLADVVDVNVATTPHPDEPDAIYAAMAEPDTGRVGRRNLLRNPGFEQASLSDWPDYYQFDLNSPRLGQAGVQPTFGLDASGPFEGRTALWIQSKSGARGANGPKFYAACAPLLDQPKTYTLSAYMRADRPGVKVRFLGFGYRVPKPTFGYQEFTLTTEWQRYSETGTLPAKLPHWHSVGAEIVKGQEGKVWFDGMQLEEGEGATEFEP